jgi:hypothetical protein
MYVLLRLRFVRLLLVPRRADDVRYEVFFTEIFYFLNELGPRRDKFHFFLVLVALYLLGAFFSMDRKDILTDSRNQGIELRLKAIISGLRTLDSGIVEGVSGRDGYQRREEAHVGNRRRVIMSVSPHCFVRLLRKSEPRLPPPGSHRPREPTSRFFFRELLEKIQRFLLIPAGKECVTQGTGLLRVQTIAVL